MCFVCCWLLFCSAIVHSQAHSLRSCCMWFWMSDSSFSQHFLNFHWSGVLIALFWLLHGWCCMKLLPPQCSVYTIQPCTLICHFMQSHICGVHVCLTVTCHLQLWQNYQDLLHATVVKWGWNRYWNKSARETEKKILPLLLMRLKPMTFWSQVWCSNHWAIPAPHCSNMYIYMYQCSSHARILLTLLLVKVSCSYFMSHKSEYNRECCSGWKKNCICDHVNTVDVKSLNIL